MIESISHGATVALPVLFSVTCAGALAFLSVYAFGKGSGVVE